MKKQFPTSIKCKWAWSMVVLIMLVCLLGKFVLGGYNLLRLVYADLTRPQYRQVAQDTNMALPAFESKRPVWLGVLASDNLWLLEFSEQDIRIQQIAVLDYPNKLVDCTAIPATLCAVSWHSEENQYTLYRYDIRSSQAISETFGLPAALPDMRTDIIAITEQGKLLAQSDNPKTILREAYKIYFQSSQAAQTLFKSTEDCMSPQLSPAGDWLAVLCLKDFDEARMSPFAETGQYLYLVRLDGSEVRKLKTPPTYYFHFRTVSDGTYPAPGIPAYKWSQNGKEIIFAASFSPPGTKNLSDWFKYGSGVYTNDGIDVDLYGGIYSGSLENGPLTKWADVGGWYPSLAWSPDRNYVAYTQEGKLYMASRWGSYRQIDLPEELKFSDDVNRPVWLAWSPGGDYILSWTLSEIWVLATQDYSWQKIKTRFGARGEEVIWIASPIP